MYCASHPERLVTIAEIAERHQVSKNHLMKVVTCRPPGACWTHPRARGRLRLLAAGAIRVGDVARVRDRLPPPNVSSRIRHLHADPCRLKGVLGKA
jgi:Rrf2 family nitric oxide-sensitive transcriptional repressor